MSLVLKYIWMDLSPHFKKFISKVTSPLRSFLQYRALCSGCSSIVKTLTIACHFRLSSLKRQVPGGQGPCSSFSTILYPPCGCSRNVMVRGDY